MVKCDLTHNIIFLETMLKVNSFKIFQNTKAFNNFRNQNIDEYLRPIDVFKYYYSFSCLFVKQNLKAIITSKGCNKHCAHRVDVPVFN